MKKFLLGTLVLIILLSAYLFFNYLTFSSKQINVDAVELVTIPEAAREHMSKAISIPTISPENSADFDSVAFYKFKDFIKTTYPVTDSLLEVTYVKTFSMIFKWPGSDASLKPAIIMGHHDVVPVAEENRKNWTEAPFSGDIKNGYIWGRGAIDDKINVIGNLEAVELLLAQGYTPKRTLYLCFGHDEEIGGEGAQAIVQHLKGQKVQAEFVLDEGFAISQGLIPGIEKDVALIGTAEKGFVTLKLSVNLEGGHSSIPKKETAIDVLANAVVKLKKNPFPAQVTPPLRDFMAHAGPEMSFLQKLAFANPGIFQSMIFSTYEKQPSGNALIRTTTSPTIINAGIKENVIPYEARASVNFRTLPGTSIEEVKSRVRETIGDDRIQISESEFHSEAPKASSIESFGYQTINTTIKQVFPHVLTTPNLVVGATDSRHYYAICPDIYRFTPFYLNSESIKTFHGIDEKIPVEDFENAVRFYLQLIKNATTN
ncbi:MAG: M20 family peptidase [Bacteroidota bacterium]